MCGGGAPTTDSSGWKALTNCSTGAGFQVFGSSEAKSGACKTQHLLRVHCVSLKTPGRRRKSSLTSREAGGRGPQQLYLLRQGRTSLVLICRKEMR